MQPQPQSQQKPNLQKCDTSTRWRQMRLQMRLQLLAAVACLALGASIAPLRSAAYPSGAPESACKDMKPGHGVEPSAGAAPFELSHDRAQAAAGDQIKVTLSSPSKDTFKGLMVQATDEKGEPVGKFLAGKGLKTLDSCAAVTHADKEPKKTATLVWEPPSDWKEKQSVNFRATVVQKFSEFHVNIKSKLGASGAGGSSEAVA